MNESVSQVLDSRATTEGGMRHMVAWSVAAHLVLLGAVLLKPGGWLGADDEPPRTVMTISLGGAPGPRAGGMTPMGGRAVQAPTPPEPAPRPETPPAARTPAMAEPAPTPPRPRPRPPVDEAPAEATGRTPTTGDVPQQGDARADTGARGQGFGLTTGGGGGTGAYLDVGDFCCPEYLEQMIQLVQQNWQARHNVAGVTLMKFTIERTGQLSGVQVEQPSGFVALDLAAQRALLLTARLPALPAAFPNPTLTVHMRFEYQR